MELINAPHISLKYIDLNALIFQAQHWERYKLYLLGLTAYEIVPYHCPTFGAEAQGSSMGKGSPFCSSSMEMLSGERINAM